MTSIARVAVVYNITGQGIAFGVQRAGFTCSKLAHGMNLGPIVFDASKFMPVTKDTQDNSFRNCCRCGCTNRLAHSQ